MKFMKYKHLFFLFSLVFLVPGLISLAKNGLRPAIDFTGGALLEVRLIKAEITSLEEENTESSESAVVAKDPTDVGVDQLYEVLESVYPVSSINMVDKNQFVVKSKVVSQGEKEAALESLTKSFGLVETLRFEVLGPILGRELLVKTLTAVALVAGMITLYIWHRFRELKFGVCAVLAMAHDSVILLGSFSLLGWWLGVEVDVLFVTALLTTLSFSIHDTIVVYDRIRELKQKHSKTDSTTILDAAVSETLSRSFNNSVTIIVMLAALVLLGGESIRWFSVALLIGAVTGTYSSTFTAAPLLLVWEEFFESRKKK